jgi:hypothetical protein
MSIIKDGDRRANGREVIGVRSFAKQLLYTIACLRLNDLGKRTRAVGRRRRPLSGIVIARSRPHGHFGEPNDSLR